MTRARVKDNEAMQGAGASVGCEPYDAVEIGDSQFEGNVASVRGGGIEFFDECPATIIRSAMVSNDAPEGAGLFLAANLTLLDSTISSNQATDAGSGSALFTLASHTQPLHHCAQRGGRRARAARKCRIGRKHR